MEPFLFVLPLKIHNYLTQLLFTSLFVEVYCWEDNKTTMTKQHLTTFLLITQYLFFSSSLLAQVTTVLCVAHTSNCGCIEECCTGPTAADCNGATPDPTDGTCSPYGTGNCSRATNTLTVAVPPNSDISVDTETNRCGDNILVGPGLDGGDGITIEEVQVVSGSGNADAIFNGCFATQSNGTDLEITLSTNRKDECINITYNITANGGTPGVGCTILASSVTKFKTALKPNKGVLLSWETPLNHDASKFIVEKSNNGLQFETMDFIQAYSSQQQYQVLDQNPFPGTNYYRIKVLSGNNQTAYTNINTIHYKTLNFFILSNPVGQYLNISFDQTIHKEVELSIINIMGQPVKKDKFHPNTSILAWDISHLQSGPYILNFQSNGQIVSKKILKK